MSMCECVLCCDGEHAGSCKECAGWGSNNEEDSCSYCAGTGDCPVCHAMSVMEGGANLLGKTLLFAIVLGLLGVGSAWADTLQGPFHREIVTSGERYTEVSADGIDFIRLPRTGCERKMEAVFRQLELDAAKLETQRSNVPMWELHAMLQRRPMWTDAKRECWTK